MSTSSGRILGSGVSFVYASNVKENFGSLRNLSFKTEVLDKSDISGTSYVTCQGTYPSFPIPRSHSILSFSRFLLFECHLIVLPFTLSENTSPSQSHQSEFMETITSLTVVSDRFFFSNLTFPYRLVIGSPIPFHHHREFHAEFIRGHTCLQLLSHGYFCVVHRHEFISLPFQHSESGTSPEYLLMKETLLLDQFPTSCVFLFHRQSSFFVLFPFFFLFFKTVVRCHTIHFYPE